MTALRWNDIFERPTRHPHKAVLRRSLLYVGLLADPVAELRLAGGGKHYWVYSDLPLLFPKPHGPLEEMREYVSHRVELWLQVAAHDEPILLDGAGI